MTTALLATFNTSAWPISRQDKRLRDKIGLTQKSGRAIRNRLLTSDPRWRAICRARDMARATHYAYTLPWQEGLRLVNPLAVEEYSEQMDKAERVYWAAVDAMLDDLDRMKAEYVIELEREGNAEFYREADYADLCKAAFDFSVSLQPMPHDSQFDQLAELIGAERAQELAQEMNDRQAKQWHSATRSVWQRVYDALRHASDKLNHGERLHDSVMDNLQELADLLPVLNISNDVELEQARKELNALFRSYSSVTVKDKDNRKTCAARVDAILAKLPSI